jgi:antitoxin (DNA-binding transcriptional repressor) of toxin-antitoxin stability system
VGTAPGLDRLAFPAPLPPVLDRVDKGERFTVTRDGEPWAVLLPTNEALWCEALAARFRGRLPPFTQEALGAWIADVMARADLSELLALA